MAQPMIGGIYTADPERLSLRATLPRFLEMEREHGSVIRAMEQSRSTATKQSSDKRSGTGVSGARYSLFLSFDRGMQVIVDELARRLPESSIQLNSQAHRFPATHSSKWQVQFRATAVRSQPTLLCLAVPAYTAASSLRPAEEELAQALDRSRVRIHSYGQPRISPQRHSTRPRRLWLCRTLHREAFDPWPALSAA